MDNINSQPVKKKKKSNLFKRKQRAGYWFILPWVIGVIAFFLKPFAISFWYSFNEVIMGAEGFESKFVGIDNYKFLIVQDSSFLMNLWTVIQNTFQQVVICAVLSLFISVVLVQKFRGRTIYRAIYFLPVIMTSGVVYSLVSSVVGSSGLSGSNSAYMYSSFSITQLLVQGGVSAGIVTEITKFIDSIFAMIPNCGVPILLYISSLQKIPNSFYEAARVEGASTWDIFWKITVPKIAPVIFLNTVYIIVDATTSYGSGSGGNIMMQAIHTMGFGKTMQFGMSSAMAWMYFLAIALFLGISYLLIGRWAKKFDK
ncbi:MAG: sugar ABC transporter permease [Clostridia bacterium]|nr:sugar ABC transporter permease [Clostridia bacterium]